MATNDLIRASDSDRDAVVDTLREAYTAGRLTLDEFSERMTAAYAGKTWGDLRALTADLPIQPVLGGDVPGSKPPPRPLPVHPQLSGQPDRRGNPVAILIPVAVWTMIALLGGVAHGAAFLVFAMVAISVFVAAIRRRLPVNPVRPFCQVSQGRTPFWR